MANGETGCARRSDLIRQDASLRVCSETGAVIEKLNTGLDGNVAGLTAPDQPFGATLFSNGDVAPFSIGPVTFESRLIWLACKKRRAKVTPVTERRVKRVWAGVRVGPRKNSRDKLREDDIVKAIRPCLYVCTVK